MYQIEKNISMPVRGKAKNLECLMNAEHNLKGGLPFQAAIGREQLHNAVVLLEKGYGINDKVEELIEEYGVVEDVPEKAE